MSTRAQIRFATREDGVSFSEHPEKIHAQFYVHHDGYPEGLGVNIAESMLNGFKIDLEIQSLTANHDDLNYIYYVWQSPGKTTWVSIFKVNIYASICEISGQCITFEDECIFVGEPQKLIDKYEYNDR